MKVSVPILADSNNAHPRGDIVVSDCVLADDNVCLQVEDRTLEVRLSDLRRALRVVFDP